MFKGESANGTDLQKPAWAGFIYCRRSLSFEVTGINFVTRKRNRLSPGIGTSPTDPMKMQETPRLRDLYPIDQPYWMVVAVDAAMIKEFGLTRFAAHNPANHTIYVIDPALFIMTSPPGMPRDRQTRDRISSSCENNIKKSEQTYWLPLFTLSSVYWWVSMWLSKKKSKGAS